MDYCLNAGDGSASFWTGVPDVDLDGDGEFDSVRIDFDGDGLFDDALTDTDDDGLGDHAALDLDDDGVPEGRYTDDGTGTWAIAGGVPARPMRWFGLEGVEHSGAGPADLDGDGRPERLLDVDRDGLADRALVDGADDAAHTGYVDTDGDGRWDVMLSDADGDGLADGAAPV